MKLTSSPHRCANCDIQRNFKCWTTNTNMRETEVAKMWNTEYRKQLQAKRSEEAPTKVAALVLERQVTPFMTLVYWANTFSLKYWKTNTHETTNTNMKYKSAKIYKQKVRRFRHLCRKDRWQHLLHTHIYQSHSNTYRPHAPQFTEKY